MTYNNGKVETGTRENGELVAPNAPKAGENSINREAPTLRALEVNPNPEPPDPETAEQDLQKSYDNLKGSLQGDALQNLTAQFDVKK